MLPLLLTLTLSQTPPVPPTVTAVPPAEPVPAVELRAEAGAGLTLRSPVPMRWAACDPAARLTPIGDGRECVFFTALAGRYMVFAAPAEGPIVPVRVTVGAAPSPPAPPDPPPPDPPPGPADPLAVAMRAAFDADPLPLGRRRVAATVLTAVYTAAADVFADPAVTTVQEHSRRVKLVADGQLAKESLPADSLTGVRKVAAAEPAAAFPSGRPAVLDAAARRAAGEVYRRAAAACGGLAR